MRLLWACILLSAPAILSYGCSSKPKSDSIRITTVTIGGYKELNDFSNGLGPIVPGISITMVIKNQNNKPIFITNEDSLHLESTNRGAMMALLPKFNYTIDSAGIEGILFTNDFSKSMISKLDLNDSLSFTNSFRALFPDYIRIHGIISGIMVDTLISTSEVQTRNFIPIDN